MSESTATRELVVTREYDASVVEVWKAWTEPDYVKQWWGPDGFTCPVANLDVREGGTSLVSESSPEYGTNYSLWAYEKVVPNERIEYVHNLADENGNQRAPEDLGMPADFPQDVYNIVTFEAIGENKTKLTVTEQANFSDQWYDLSKMCLEQCLDKMGRIFSER